MRLIKIFAPPDFQAKKFTPLISQNFNSFGDDNTQKNECKWRILHCWPNFTLPLTVTAVTKLTSAYILAEAREPDRLTSGLFCTVLQKNFVL